VAVVAGLWALTSSGRAGPLSIVVESTSAGPGPHAGEALQSLNRLPKAAEQLKP